MAAQRTQHVMEAGLSTGRPTSISGLIVSHCTVSRRVPHRVGRIADAIFCLFAIETASPEKTDHPRRRHEGSRREFKRCSRLFQRSPPPAIRICSQCLLGCQDRFQLIEANARETGPRVFSLSDAGIAYSIGTTASIRIVSTAKSKMTRFAVFCHYRVDSSTKNLLIWWKSKENPVTTGSGSSQLAPSATAACCFP